MMQYIILIKKILKFTFTVQFIFFKNDLKSNPMLSVNKIVKV